MTEPTTDGPTEEEMRAYLESLRAAQPVEIVVQAFGILATAAEVKLGRDDARALIDGMGALLEATADRMPADIVDRMRQTVTQLQLAQVQVEREGRAQDADAGAAATTTEPEEDEPAQPRPDVSSRLWIPGRD